MRQNDKYFKKLFSGFTWSCNNLCKVESDLDFLKVWWHFLGQFQAAPCSCDRPCSRSPHSRRTDSWPSAFPWIGFPLWRNHELQSGLGLWPRWWPERWHPIRFRPSWNLLSGRVVEEQFVLNFTHVLLCQRIQLMRKWTLIKTTKKYNYFTDF